MCGGASGIDAPLLRVSRVGQWDKGDRAGQGGTLKKMIRIGKIGRLLENYWKIIGKLRAVRVV